MQGAHLGPTVSSHHEGPNDKVEFLHLNKRETRYWSTQLLIALPDHSFYVNQDLFLICVRKSKLECNLFLFLLDQGQEISSIAVTLLEQKPRFLSRGQNTYARPWLRTHSPPVDVNCGILLATAVTRVLPRRIFMLVTSGWQRGLSNVKEIAHLFTNYEVHLQSVHLM